MLFMSKIKGLENLAVLWGHMIFLRTIPISYKFLVYIIWVANMTKPITFTIYIIAKYMSLNLYSNKFIFLLLAYLPVNLNILNTDFTDSR